MSNKAFLQTLNNRNGHSDQTVYQSAFFAGEVRMTLNGTTAVRKLEMPGSFVGKSLMHQAGPAETLEGTVNGDFIEVIFAQPPCNLVLPQWFVGCCQHFQYSYSAFGAVKFYRFQYPAAL